MVSTVVEEVFGNFHPELSCHLFVHRFVGVYFCESSVIANQSQFNGLTEHVQDAVQDNLGFPQAENLFRKFAPFFQLQGYGIAEQIVFLLEFVFLLLAHVQRIGHIEENSLTGVLIRFLCLQEDYQLVKIFRFGEKVEGHVVN